MNDDQGKTKKNPLGATGQTVADNIKRLRGDMAYTKLAAKLEEIGRPIPTLGLRKIESYERRVDADDLIALAVALEVSPITLLMPDHENPGDDVRITGIDETASAAMVWEWLRANALRPGQESIRLETWPGWERAWMQQVVITGLSRRRELDYGNDQ